MRRIFVIAPSAAEFLAEARARANAWTNTAEVHEANLQLILYRDWEIGDIYYNYISSPDRLRGQDYFEVERWDRYWLNPEYQNIEDALRGRRLLPEGTEI